MTISLAGATGVSTTSAARGTSSTAVAYTAVAAGRLAVITAVVKPSTATWGSDPAGWTKITDATGGTGTNAADTGTSRIGKWYRVLDGSESGSVTITSTNSPSATAGCMDVYSKTLGHWDTPISVTGADTTHGTNPTAASGTWSGSLQVGDVVHAGYATDTDSTTATTGQAISQSGTTFGTVTARSRVGNSSGNQNSVFTWDATVTAVTSGASTGTGATTMTLTWSASSCGAFGALRIREYDDMSAVTDDFDDGTQNPKVYGPDSYGTYSETGGRMRLDVSTTYAGVYSPNAYRFDDVFFHPYPAAANGAATEAYSAFWLDAKDQADGTMLGFFYESINDQLYLSSWVGYSDASQVILNSAATNHPYWRLLRSSGNVLWQTSTDGSSWTTQRTAAMPSWLANGTALAMWWECHRADGTANNYEVDGLNIASSVTTNGTASVTGSGSVTATGSVIISGTASTTGAGSVSAVAATRAGSSAAGTGSVTATAATISSASVSGSGSVSATASVVTNGTATVPGSGSVTAAATVRATSAVTGSGSTSAAGSIVVAGMVPVLGTGSTSAAATTRATAAAVGTGTTSANVTHGGTAAVAGAGSVSANAGGTVPGTASVTGAGSVTATPALRSTSAVTGQGSVSATGMVISYGTAAVNGSGSVAAAARLLAGATAVGAGQVSASLAQVIQGTAAVMGTGVVMAVTSSRTTPRPVAGTTPRPASGITPRPLAGVTPRP